MLTEEQADRRKQYLSSLTESGSRIALQAIGFKTGETLSMSSHDAKRFVGKIEQVVEKRTRQRSKKLEAAVTEALNGSV